jgi:hypothetical protein
MSAGKLDYMECSVDGCTTSRGDRSVCYMHAGRWRTYRSYELPPPTSREDIFWAQVHKTEACWLWTGLINPYGYGRIWHDGAMTGAHRVSYTLAKGPVPRGLHVCHHCDNPSCVRPDHLYLGDDARNLADMVARKRSAWGERNFHHKLTAEEVRAIRAATAAGWKYRGLAERYGVSEATISDVHRRRSWRHLD